MNKDSPNEYFGLFAWETEYVGFGSTAQSVKNEPTTSEWKVPSIGTVRTGGARVVKARAMA